MFWQPGPPAPAQCHFLVEPLARFGAAPPEGEQHAPGELLQCTRCNRWICAWCARDARFQGQGAQHASGGAAPPRRQVSNVGREGGGVPKPSARNESTRLQSTSAEVFQSPVRGILPTSVDSQFDFRRQDSGGAPASARPLYSRAARFRGRERASVRGRSRKTELRQRQRRQLQERIVA